MSKAIEALAAELLNLRERIRLLEMQEPSGGTDPNAIHVNVAAEISAIAAKAVPIGADYLVIEDSAAADVKKSITIADLPIAAVVPNHDHTGDAGDGAQISHDTALTGVSSDDHHAQAHKDTHDPEDGGDPLDTEAPVDTGTANAIGTSHNLVRGDHVHKLHDHLHAGVAGDGATLDHGALTGRGDDDHTQYILHSDYPPGCRAIRTSAQSLPNGAVTALSFNSQVHDTDGCFAPTDTKLYARTAGYYLSGFSVALAAPGSAIARKIALLVKQDGAQYLAENDVYVSLNVAAGTSVTTGMFYMAVNEYVEFYVYHNTGAAVDTLAADANNQHYCNGWLMRVA